MKNRNNQLLYRRMGDGDGCQWNYATGLDEMRSTGSYIIQLRHGSAANGLPLPACTNDHYIEATLIVAESGTDDRLQKNRLIGQTLIMPQCSDGKTHIFTRTLNCAAGGSAWSSWDSVATMAELDARISGTKDVVWGASSCVDTFVTAGVYNINGQRLNVNDALPIANSNPGHTISARLVVLDSSIAGTGDEQDKCITQMLTLSNRTGGDGDVYIRTGRAHSTNVLAGGSGWEPWGKLQQNIEVGQVTSLDTFTGNGIYSGVYTNGSSFFETFVMVVINNYAVAGATGNIRCISQFKYALNVDGTFSYKTRTGRGSAGIEWGSWVDLGAADTTDIQDGAITAQKLSAALLEQINQNTANATKAANGAYWTSGPDAVTLNINKNDGTVGWQTLPAATTENAGVMSAEDKRFLSNIKIFETKPVPLSMTTGNYYDESLVLKSNAATRYCEIDVSQYQGCLVKLKVKTRATIDGSVTGLITYCGFVDEDGNKIHSFCVRYATSVMEDDTVVIPVPRAFTAQDQQFNEVSFKGAAKLLISSYTGFDCSLDIVTKCNDNRLRGKNVAVVGSSNAALYFSNDCRINKGWFLYHLAPLFGYNCTVRNVGGSGWSDITRQFELCKQDIADTGKDYFDIVYLAETTNDGMGQFLDDYNSYVQGFCKELLYSGSDSIDSGLNDVCKAAANSVKGILNNSPRARMYIQMGIFNGSDFVEGKGALYLGQELKYENNFLKALCDVFNIKKVSYCNGSSYRVWKDGPWWVWQGQSNGNTSDINTGQQVLDQGDGIHASKPRGGWDQFKVFFSTLWGDFAADAMFDLY